MTSSPVSSSPIAVPTTSGSSSSSSRSRSSAARAPVSPMEIDPRSEGGRKTPLTPAHVRRPSVVHRPGPPHLALASQREELVHERPDTVGKLSLAQGHPIHAIVEGYRQVVLEPVGPPRPRAAGGLRQLRQGPLDQRPELLGLRRGEVAGVHR